MKVRPIDLSNLHPKLQVVLAWVEWIKPSTHEIEITSTWRNDSESVHYFGRGADIVINRYSDEPMTDGEKIILKTIAERINEFFAYGKGKSLVAVDETQEPANPEKAAIWGPHIHLQVRDETRLK